MRRHHWAGALVGRKYEVVLLEKYKGVTFGYRNANGASPGVEPDPPSATDLVGHTYNQLYAARGARLGARQGAYQQSVREWQASSNAVSR